MVIAFIFFLSVFLHLPTINEDKPQYDPQKISQKKASFYADAFYVKDQKEN